MAFKDNTQGQGESKVETIKEDLMQCSICLGEYDNPRCLPCLHSFCEKCLSRYVGNTKKFLCPLCNQEHKVPSSGVNAFPPNYLLNHLREIVDSEESASIDVCQVCQAKKVNSVCIDCHRKMCSDCIDDHQRRSQNKEHRIVSPEEYLKEVGMDKAQLFMPREVECNNCRNKQNILEMYCEKCDLPLCKKCSVEKHGSHKCVNLENISERYRKALSRNIHRMEAKHEKYVKSRGKFENADMGFENQHKGEADKIRLHSRKIRSISEEEEGRCLRELRSFYDREKESYKHELKKIKEKIGKIDTVITRVRYLEKHGNPAQIVSAKPLIDQYTKDIEDSAIEKPPESGTKPRFLRFGTPYPGNFGSVRKVYVNGESLELAIKQSRVIKQGEFLHCVIRLESKNHDEKLHVETSLETSVKSPNSPAREFDRVTLNEDELVLKVKFLERGTHKLSVKFERKDIKGSPFSVSVKPEWKNVRIVGDFRRSGGAVPSLALHGIAVDKKRKVVVADSANGLHKLAYPKDKRRIILPKTLSSYPQFVAVSRDNKYYVTDSARQKVLVCDNKGKVLKYFVLQGPGGIAINNDAEVVYVVYKTKPTLKIYTLNGEYIKAFNENVPDKFRLKNPHGVGVTSTGNVIVSDTNKHNIQVYNADGKFLFAFGSEGNELGQLKSPEGVAVDKENNVFVCDRDNNRVQKFDEEGRFVCCLNDETVNLQTPSEIAIDDDHGRVFVTASDSVYVFE